MDQATARARLEAMTDAQSEVLPLSEVQVDLLLALARRSDRYGAWPADEGWEGTYDLNAAAAEGWRWKAARAAGQYSFSADGASYSRSDMAAHCRAMVDHYARKVHGSVPVGYDPAGDLLDAPVANW